MKKQITLLTFIISVFSFLLLPGSVFAEVQETNLIPWDLSDYAYNEEFKAYDSQYEVKWNKLDLPRNYPGNTSDHINNGNKDQFWEVYDAGSANVDFTFPELVTFRRMVYGSRLDAYLKGYPSEFEIWTSQTETGDNWVQVAHGTGSETSKLCKIDFENDIQARRVRFRFVTSRENRPSIRDMRFYKEDPNETYLNNIWKDYAHTQFSDGLSTDEVSKKVNELKSCSWNDFAYGKEVKRIEQVLNNEVPFDSTLVRSNEAHSSNPTSDRILRIGDLAGYARNTLKFPNGCTNRQVTGIWYPANEEIHIWVNAEYPDDKLPLVRWAQPYGYWASWQGGQTQLHAGENIIKVPNYKTVDYKTYDIVAGCAAYIENPWNETEQKGNVDVYFEKGHPFPVYRLGDDIDQYMQELREHADRVRQDHTQEMDVTELVSNHVMMTVQATRADELYGARGHNAEMSLTEWNETLHRCLQFEGISFDENGEHYDIRNNYLNENYRVSQVWDYGWMFTAGEHIGVYTGGEAQDVLIDCLDKYGKSIIGPNWGLIHEWGHSIDIPARSIQETTNNMAPYFESQFYPDFYRNTEDIERANKMALPGYEEGTMFNQNRYNFMPFWLVESYWPGWWGKVSNLYRYTPETAENGWNINGNSKSDKLKKTERMVLYASEASGYDLRYWFQKWGLNIDSNEQPFNADNATDEFKAQFEKKISEGKIHKQFDDFEQVPLWFQDRAQYLIVKAAEDAKNRNSLHIYNESSPAPNVISVDHGTKTVEIEENGTKRSETYETVNVTIEKNTDQNHLCYLVESRPHGSDEEWVNAGYTHGGVFTDERRLTKEEFGKLEYRVCAMDRSLHTSSWSDAHTFSTESEVARLTSNGQSYNSLAEAVAAAQETDTISLLKNCSGSSISIIKNLTIEPDNTDVTIGRLGDGPLFTLDADVTFKLNSKENAKLTLDGYLADSKKAAIYSTAKTRIEANNVIFKNFVNIDQNANGYGSVFNASYYETRAVFENCEFKNNRALHGGAVASRGTLWISECKLENNTARGNGGALYNYSGGIVYLKDSQIINNTAVNGGGIYMNGLTLIRSCEITGNTGKYGGAIDTHLGGRQAVIGGDEGKPTKIENNSALAGNAIYQAENGTLLIGNAEIDANNEASAIQHDNGKILLNANYSEVSPAISNVNNFKDVDDKTLSQWFGDNNKTELNGTVAESGANVITLVHQWPGGSQNYNIEDLGRPQPIVEVKSFTPETNEISQKVKLDGIEKQLDLEYKTTEELSGVYVKQGGKVHFELNGGEIKSGNLTGYTSGVITYLPTDVYKKGCSFVGWFKDPDLTGSSIRSIPADQVGDVTYYAKWSQGIYWINYRPNGGSMPEGTVIHRGVDETSLLVDPIRPDYTFLGWYEKSDLTGEPITSIKAGTEKDVAIYAKYDHHKDKGVKISETAATCTEKGYAVYTYKCVDCEKPMPSETIEIPATGHKWSGWEKRDKQTCDGKDLLVRKCSKCGAEETQNLDTASNSCDWGEWKVIKEASCSDTGVKEATCKNCGAVKSEFIPKLEHQYDSSQEVREEKSAATCTLPGVVDIKNKCTVCQQETIVRTENINPKGHTWKTLEEYQAEQPEQTVNMTSDGWIIEATRNPDESAGAIYRRVCRECNTVERRQDSFEHDWGTEKQVIEEPTCTSVGTKAFKCSHCGATKDEEEIPALGHDFSNHESQTCLRCNEPNIHYVNPTPSESEKNPGEGHVHSWSDVWAEDPAPTCTTPGVRFYYCSDPNCDAVNELTQETIPALGHDYGTAEENRQTCIRCDNPNPNYVPPESVCQHSNQNQVIQVEATCTTPGINQNICTDCGAVVSATPIEPLGHDYQEGICSRCHEPLPSDIESQSDDYEVPSDGPYYEPHPDGQHSYSTELVTDIAATCTDYGVQSYHCTICNKVVNLATIPPLGHDFGDNQSNCTRCNAVNENYKKVCQHVRESGEEIEIEPTCVASGVDKICCVKCGEILEEKAIPALGHDFGPNNQAPTCLRDNCDAGNPNFNIKDDPNHVHSYNENYTVDKEPTCTEVGVKSRHCSLWACPSTTDTKLIPPLGHNFVNGICTRCGVQQSEETEPVEPTPEPDKPSEEEPEVVLNGFNLSLDKITLTTTTGGRISETVSVTPDPVDYSGDFNWTTKNPNIASVEGNGTSAVITAKSNGTTTVNVESDGITKSIPIVVSNNKIVADGIEVNESSPDYIQVTVKNVHANDALNSTDPISKVSIFGWTNEDQSDLNAKVAERVGNTNDWTYTFPVNETAEGNYFINAGKINIHAYSTTEGGNNEFLGLTTYAIGSLDNDPLDGVGYVQDIGFIIPSSGNGEMIGTEGQARQLEGLRLSTSLEGVDINYSVHASDLGWLNEVKDGTYTGTMHQNRQLEAIKVWLSGVNADKYTVNVQAHVADKGWLPVVGANEVAGTTGENRRLEAVIVTINPK